MGQCFVGGNFVDPRGDPAMFIWAAPGLAGPALELAPEEAVAPAAVGGETGAPKTSAGEDHPALQLGQVSAQKYAEAVALVDKLQKELAAANKKVSESETVIAELQKQIEVQAQQIEAAHAAAAGAAAAAKPAGKK